MFFRHLLFLLSFQNLLYSKRRGWKERRLLKKDSHPRLVRTVHQSIPFYNWLNRGHPLCEACLSMPGSMIFHNPRFWQLQCKQYHFVKTNPHKKHILPRGDRHLWPQIAIPADQNFRNAVLTGHPACLTRFCHRRRYNRFRTDHHRG